MAFVCWPEDSKDISITRIITLDGSQSPIDISFRKDYLGIDYSQPLPEGVLVGVQNLIEYQALVPTHWTADDKYLYLSKGTPVSGVVYGGIMALMRIELATKKITPILAPGGFYWYTFSRDDTKLYYIDQSKKPMTFIILTLESGAINEFTLDGKFSQAGDVMPSPDMQKIILGAVVSEGVGAAIILVDLTSMSQENLLEGISFNIWPKSWVDNRTLYCASDYNLEYYYLDIITKQISSAPTPTPYPYPYP